MASIQGHSYSPFVGNTASSEEWSDEVEQQEEEDVPVARSMGMYDKPTIEAILKSLVIYLQTLGAVLEVFGAEWSAAAKVFGDVVDHANIQITGLGCSGLDFAGQFYFFLALLPALLLLLGIAFMIRLFSSRNADNRPVLVHSSDELSSLPERAVNIALVLVYFMFFPLLFTALTMFACESSESGTYLAHAPWIRCWSSTHQPLAGVAGAVIVCLGVLTVFVAVAMRDPIRREESFEFLCSGYNQEMWWFEGLVVFRRIVVALLAAVLPKNSPFASVFLTVVLGSAFAAVLVLNPYRSPLASRLEAASVAMSGVSVVLAASLAYADQSSESTVVALSAMFIFGNSLVIICYIVALSWPLYKALKHALNRCC